MSLEQKYNNPNLGDFQNYLEKVQQMLNEDLLNFKNLPLTEELFDVIIYDLESSYEKGETAFVAVKNLYLSRFNIDLNSLNV